jgi:conjugative relaxase-like TrwC/TraI family protein
MLTISKPLSAAQARTYHAEEFSSARDNYYTTGHQIVGHWHGQLADQWGLRGEVREEHLHRLTDGTHPFTGEPLVRHQRACQYTNARGSTVKTMEHGAGWDATFSAPKSVSLTALVGRDERVRAAHRASVAVALDQTERYVQARLGGNRPAETTGNWVAATFEHDSARPVAGYAAPQLHTHAVFFNLTHTASGEIRPLQPRELYRTQQYVTAVYRSELATRLHDLGYDIERGASGQPEIRGYTPGYLDASSPRRQQIQAHLEKAHQRGAGAAQIAAHQTREAKLDRSREEMQARHRDMAAAFGDQPARVVQEAHERAHVCENQSTRMMAQAAVTFAKERNLEREAVVDERELLRDALKRSMGEVTVRAIRAEFEQRVAAEEFISVAQKPGAAGRAFTTREMLDIELDTIQMMRAGQQTQPALSGASATALAYDHPYLNDHQRTVVAQILASHDQIAALEGVAGAGKTTALAAVRDEAERGGYTVEGFAPTSRAAQKLGEAGIASSTLQRYLTRSEEPQDGQRRLYILDESSLTGTKQMNGFLRRLNTEDRVLLVGDVRQHQAVEAGRPYQQLQEAGMETARLEGIVRQQDPALKAVVEQLSRGEVAPAIQQLDTQGRVHEIADRQERLMAIAREYLNQPDDTLVVSPDNQSRVEINQVIHCAMQREGHVNRTEHRARVLVARQEITGADRQWAERYDCGDIVRYSKGSQRLSVQAGEYARVEHVNAKENLVTVRRDDGHRITYDPRRLQGVTLYRESDRAFGNGDRVQFTAPDRERYVANRELGTIEQIDSTGRLRLRLDSGRTVAFALRDRPHLDYGYAVTSHSSQGQTADRVLVHVDTARAADQLLNRRLAYVALSRGRHDAQIYTNDKTHLAETLSRDIAHRSAMEPSLTPDSSGESLKTAVSLNHPAQQTIHQGLER